MDSSAAAGAVLADVAYVTQPYRTAMDDAKCIEFARALTGCVICHHVAWAPVVALPCNHIFCESCLGTSLRTRPTCPKCRQRVARTPALKTYDRLMYDNVWGAIEVRCPNQDAGCSWHGSYSAVEAHATKSCLFQPFPCTRCHKPLLREERKTHADECAQRDVACDHCHEVVARSFLGKHARKCARAPVPCCVDASIVDGVALHPESGDAPAATPKRPRLAASPSSSSPSFSSASSSSATPATPESGAAGGAGVAVDTGKQTKDRAAKAAADGKKEAAAVDDAAKEAAEEAAEEARPGCGALVPRADMARHHLTACARAMVPCPIAPCAARLRRQDLLAHIRSAAHT